MTAYFKIFIIGIMLFFALHSNCVAQNIIGWDVLSDYSVETDSLSENYLEVRYGIMLQKLDGEFIDVRGYIVRFDASTVMLSNFPLERCSLDIENTQFIQLNESEIVNLEIKNNAIYQLKGVLNLELKYNDRFPMVLTNVEFIK